MIPQGKKMQKGHGPTCSGGGEGKKKKKKSSVLQGWQMGTGGGPAAGGPGGHLHSNIYEVGGSPAENKGFPSDPGAALTQLKGPAKSAWRMGIWRARPQSEGGSNVWRKIVQFFRSGGPRGAPKLVNQGQSAGPCQAPSGIGRQSKAATDFGIGGGIFPTFHCAARIPSNSLRR